MLWLKILVACVPAAVIGLLFNEKFEALFYNYTTVAIALIVFGIAFLIIETRHKGKRARVNSLEEITFQLALLIGVFQLIAAIFPGTSRSGAIHCWCVAFGRIQNSSGRIYILFGNSRYVRCKLAEDCTVRLPFYWYGSCHPADRYDCSFCSVHPRNQIPDGLHQET